MKRIGPELKMPKLRGSGIKAPPFLADVYYDLRDRRLLPLVALVVVAIAAVPFLLGDSSEERLPAPAPESPSATEQLERIDASKLAVVEAKPGLRDYKKRLARRTPTDPFKQRYTALPEAAQVTSEVSSTTDVGGGDGGEVTIDAVEGGATEGHQPGGTPPAGSGGGDGGGSVDGPARLYEFVFDLQITHSELAPDGSLETGETQTRKAVKSLTALPGEKRQVVTLMGVNLRNGRVMFMVADEARAVFGDFACVERTDRCELLEIEPGLLLELEHEPSGDRYSFKVTNIDVVAAGRVGGSRSSRAIVKGPYLRGALGTP